MQRTTRPPLFSFFDIVQVVDVDGRLLEIDRKFGVILGMSQTEDGAWGYAVDIYEDQACTDRVDGWDISEGDLVATGRRAAEDRIYGGETVKVSTKGDLPSE